MKATRIDVEWTEKVTCRDTITIRWEVLMDDLGIPEEEREEWQPTEDDLLDHAFEAGLLEADIGNTKDSEILDSKLISTVQISVAPHTTPGQLTLDPS